MLADFGKRLILGLVVAACVVGVHAAMVFSSVGWCHRLELKPPAKTACVIRTPNDDPVLVRGVFVLVREAGEACRHASEKNPERQGDALPLREGGGW